MFREYNLINSDIILEHHDKYHISNAFDLKYFKDREYGVFYEFGPAISLDIPMDVCYNLVYETDWGHIPYNRNSPERILSHEIAHYSQLLGSSYGYLLYRSRLARKLFFYWVFRRNKELWPNVRIDRPCLKYFKTKLSDRNVDGLFKKLILGYIVRDLIVSWLYDYKGGDACYHVNSLITTIGEALAIDVLSREYINSDDFVFSCMYVIDVSLKQYYSKLINNAEYPSKIISPRSIIECYARSIEHWTLKPAETSKTNLKSTVFQNEHILASQGVYGYAEKYLIDKFVITFHKNKVPHLLLTLFISIYELSLMSRLSSIAWKRNINGSQIQ